MRLATPTLLALAAVLAVPAASVQAKDAPADVDPAVASQVRAISAKLRDWRGNWASIDGKLACATTKTTGDKEIDVIGCGALIACIKPIYPELTKIASGPQGREEKQRLIQAKVHGQNSCLHRKRGDGIAALAYQRGSK